MESRPRALIASAAVGVAAIAVVAAGHGSTPEPGHASGPPAKQRLPLEDPSIAVIYSETDRDAQLLISTGSTRPMASLSVERPNGTGIIDARFKHDRKLGHADFRVDTPEPSLAKLKRAYPPGTYLWRGQTVDGQRLAGRSKLSYALLEPPVITAPAAGATGLPTSGLTVRWEPVGAAKTIHLELEEPQTERVLTVDLDGGATSFVVPDGFLRSGREYVVDVKAVNSRGNLTVADLSFRTA